MVLTDAYTKWVLAKPTKDETAKTTADALVSWFLLFGIPHYIVSDQGRAFESNLIAAICDQFDITKRHTSGYRPQCNGQVERYNRTLGAALRAYCMENPKDWDLHVPFVTAAMRSTVSTATKFTPNKLFLGREVTSPADLEFVLPPQAPELHNEYVLQLQNDLRKAHDAARKHLQERCVRNKKNYDIRIMQQQFDAGDAVYVLNRTPVTGIPKKLKPVFKGPALVMKRISSYVYKVRYRQKVFYANHDELKPCHGTVPKWLERARRPERLDEPQRDNINGPFCICRKKYDGEFMIACDYCNEWFHGKCVGIGEQAGQRISSYKCQLCEDELEEFKMPAEERNARNRALSHPVEDATDEDSPSDSSADE